MMKTEFLGLRLRDVVEALERRARSDEAEYWRLVVAVELGVKHGVSEDEVLDLEMDRILYLMQLPERPEGWDNWTWGKAAVGNYKG